MNKKLPVIFFAFLFLQPIPATAFTKAEIAEAVAYSGCTWGLLLDGNKFGIEQSVNSNIGLGLTYRLIDEGLSVPGIENADTPKGRVGYSNLLQSWSTAGILSSRWKALEPTYEKGLQAGIKKWNTGSTLGVSKNSASAVALPKLTALCRIAEIGVTSKALKAKLSIRKYVIKVGGSYLPRLP